MEREQERSPYIGVYINRYKPTRASFPYRAALKKCNDGEYLYEDLGFFRSEEAAAFVYNVNSLCTYGPRAIINHVGLTPETEEELEEYMSKREWFGEMLTRAVQILEEYGPEITGHDSTCEDTHHGWSKLSKFH